jgi:hypothetical protein
MCNTVPWCHGPQPVNDPDKHVQMSYNPDFLFHIFNTASIDMLHVSALTRWVCVSVEVMGWCEGVCTWLKSFEYRIFGNIGFGGKCLEHLSVKIKIYLSTPWRHIGSGGVAPLIPNLATRWVRVANFNSRSLYIEHWIEDWVHPRGCLGILEKYFTPAGIQTPDHPAPSLSLYTD